MKKFIKYNWFFCFLCIVVGCQKDDICPEGSETTPHLVIEFYDTENTENLKAVENLIVMAVGSEDTLLGPTTVNQVEVPLRTDSTNTNYRFIIPSEGEGDSTNADIVSFFYSPTTDYINRACGYKVTFSNLTLDLEGDGDNWITSTTQKHTQIENDTTAHISFFH